LMETAKWHGGASVALLEMAKGGHPEIARQLIAELDLAEPLFPLARVLDYVLKGEEVLLEKLSPEVRKIVGEIVDQVLATSGQAKQKKPKPKARKSQTGPRRRIAKQLY
jgi:predicted component of type VI protein secretion system